MKIKTLTLLIICSFINIGVFAQFGGGSGTEEDPYRLYTSADIYELADSLDLSNTFTGKYFRLMNNIEEPINRLGVKTFDGSFNGGGHSINIDIDVGSGCLFTTIGINGILDSLKIVGNTNNFLALVCYNDGIIRNCISDVKISHPNQISCVHGFCAINNETALIESCVNLANFENAYSQELGRFDIDLMSGICYLNSGTIRKCINKGHCSVKIGEVAGIVNHSGGLVEMCINMGNLSSISTIESESDSYPCGGIIALAFPDLIVRNCINTGDINFTNFRANGGIVSDLDNYASNCLVENCFNSGKIHGYVGVDPEVSGGGIVGCYRSYVDEIYSQNNIVKNCLNISNNGGGNIIADTNMISTLSLSNNYYDKQMGLTKGFVSEDIIGIAEGKLTTQLIGTDPELQAMLGDGWSYAEGRYPIPLGLENDSIALLAATPVYLPYTDQDDYNTIDSVTCHFLLGTENNVEWECSSPTVNLEETEDGLKGVLQTSGYANLIASLGDFHKNIILNIKSVCEPSYKNEEIQKTQAIAYPNPTKDVLYFNQASAYEIYDLQGKLIMKSKKPQNFVNTSKLKSGIYLIKIGGEIMKFVVE